MGSPPQPIWPGVDCHVTVVEKNARPGGRCDRFCRDGHHFDTGPTLFVMPLLFQEEFRALGTSMDERLDLLRVDPTYHLVFDDGSQLALTSDMKSLQEQLESIQPGSFQGLLRYLQEGGRHYQLGLDKLVSRDFRKASDLFSFQNLPLLFRLKPLIPHYRNMSAYFDDPRLKAAFTFQDSYMGLSPFEAPATFSMMPYTELAHGVWYPKGGMYSVVETLTALAREAGVEFIFDTPVERIEVNSTARPRRFARRWATPGCGCGPGQCGSALCLSESASAGWDGRGTLAQEILLFRDQLLLGNG